MTGVEKLVKTYISQHGKKIKRTHSLNILFEQAKELGLIFNLRERQRASKSVKERQRALLGSVSPLALMPEIEKCLN